MRTPPHIFAILLAAVVPPPGARAHESFLLWHDHHLHLDGHGPEAMEHHDHRHYDVHHEPGDKESQVLETEVHTESRWAIGTGVRYTRLSLEGEPAHLWESGLGISYAVAPWLHIGGEASYGWFDSREGRSSGMMVPHFHAETEIPFAEGWMAALGLEVGTPGGDEGLVGNHWEIAPALTIRYERGRWFAEAGASFVFILGGDVHNHGRESEGGDHEGEDGHEEESEDHDHEEGHSHQPGDFHEVVDPHGERELQYYTAFGARLLDERLTLEGRIHGVHVTSGYTPDRDYLRAGLRASYALTENWAVRTEASVPITDARRNQWQASVSLQVRF